MDPSFWIVLSVSLVIGMTAGFFMHRSDFCLAGAFRDFFLFRAIHRVWALLLLVSVSAVLFELLRQLGWLPVYPFPWFSPPSLVNVVGGVLFGLGMVLAGGCVVGVLYKFGGGSLLAGVAIIGLLIGSGLYAEIHPLWMRLAGATRLHEEAVTLPQLTGTSPVLWVLAFAGLGSFFSFRRRAQEVRSLANRAEGYVPLWITSLVLALLGTVSVLLIGIPLGVTTSYAKIAAWFEKLVIPAHVEQLTFFSSQPVSLSLPYAPVAMYGGAGPQWDVVALVQYPLITGIVLGAAVSARLLGELKVFRHLPRRQVLLVLVGGMVMALGSRMTPGCNVWHLLGGLPILAVQSLLFLAGIMPGAWLGGVILKRVLV